MTTTCRRLLAFLLPALLLLPAPVRSQDDGDGRDSSWTAWHRKNRPFVEFGYGTAWPRHKRLAAEFPSVGSIEVRAGYLRLDTMDHGLVSVDDGFLLGAWSNEDLGGGTGGTEGLSGKLSRFGLGHRSGVGYDLGGSSIVPYFQTDISWTELKTGRPASLGADDGAILDRYEGTYRFGVSAESGIRANLGRTISLSGGYEAGVVYPRIVFWELAGSYVVSGIASGIVEWFGDDMVRSSPSLGPVFLFVLRSGVAWGVYQLWREDMNWPFPSETPLTHETLKFGLSFNL